MAWLQLQVTLDATGLERVETALLGAGALSVSFSDAGTQPLYAPDPQHPPLWRSTCVTALYPETTDPDGLRAVLLAALNLPHLPPHHFSRLEDREWTREWLRDFKPMRFGRRLWIVPSAYPEPDPAAVNLRLDPGLAFGTGTHATTALCLEWLDAATLADKTVLDYGCGSGVLAIAAALLGAARVRAVDNDPQALAATRENTRRNHVHGNIEISPPESLSAEPVDVVLANILAAPLAELAPRFAALLKPGGELVLSGILANQHSEVCAAYAPWFQFDHGARREEWRRLDARRKPGSQ